MQCRLIGVAEYSHSNSTFRRSAEVCCRGRFAPCTACRPTGCIRDRAPAQPGLASGASKCRMQCPPGRPSGCRTCSAASTPPGDCGTNATRHSDFLPRSRNTRRKFETYSLEYGTRHARGPDCMPLCQGWVTPRCACGSGSARSTRRRAHSRDPQDRLPACPWQASSSRGWCPAPAADLPLEAFGYTTYWNIRIPSRTGAVRVAFPQSK